MSVKTFANIQAILVAYLSTLPGASGVATKTGTLSASGMPFIRVQRIGGADDWFNDDSRVDIDVFAVDEVTAQQMAESVRTAMIGMSGHDFSGRTIDHVETTLAPIWVDYQNELVQRYVASYTVTSRLA
jgi:hypothetical protein